MIESITSTLAKILVKPVASDRLNRALEGCSGLEIRNMEKSLHVYRRYRYRIAIIPDDDANNAFIIAPFY